MCVSGFPTLDRTQVARRGMSFTLLLLAIEFLDELAGGALEAAWPLIRDDLNLTYAQIGLLMGWPTFMASFIEPLIGLLGDMSHRRALIVGGGASYTLGLFAIGQAHSFPTLLAAFLLFAPASGAFVSLSQASLMDCDPQRHEQLMARWTLAGSLGLVVGPLALGAAAWVHLSWRSVLIVFAIAALALTALAGRETFANHGRPGVVGLSTSLFGALRAAARGGDVRRWLILLIFSDFMLDLLLGFLALYLVDVSHFTPAQAGMAVAVWSGVGLVGDALLIPLLEKVRGLTYLRWSAAVMFVLYSSFLMIPSYWIKLVLLALLGFFNSGWYAILKGRLYSTLPGRSGTVIAVYSCAGAVGSLLPVLLGLMAQRVGLEATMWVLLLGPIALLIGLHRRP